MSAAPLFAAFAAIACEQGDVAVEQTDGIPPHCAPYVGDSDLFGYCLYSLAGGFPSEDEMKRQCSQAGDWEGECRHAWVAGRMKEEGSSLEYLLGVCGDNPDCTFEVLDFRPDPDLEVQLSLCRKYTGPHHADCAGHAAQRWWRDSPGEEELLRVGALATDYPDKVGWWVGVSVACENRGKCESGHPESRMFCESAVKTMKADPLQCPSKIPKDMHGRGDRDRGKVRTAGPSGRPER